MIKLQSHQKSPFQAFVAYRLESSRMSFRFEVQGPVDSLEIPVALESPGCRDELWKATCFEIFLSKQNKTSYIEWNFSPSGEWACYEFQAPREKLKSLKQEAWVQRPRLHLDSDSLTYENTIPLDGYSTWHACLILRTKAAQMSYWSIKDAGSPPDFHSPNLFMEI